jgi:hypothetical protein
LWQAKRDALGSGSHEQQGADQLRAQLTNGPGTVQGRNLTQAYLSTNPEWGPRNYLDPPFDGAKLVDINGLTHKIAWINSNNTVQIADYRP